MLGAGKWQLRDCERIIVRDVGLLGRRHVLIGVTRVRNEALVLRDTLDYVGRHVDAVVAYDDASTDQTREVLCSNAKVALIVANGSWEGDIKARKIAEGRNRGLLLQIARAQLQFDWMFCFDADERVIGDLRGFAAGPRASDCDGVRIRLFDAYMTPDDCAPYRSDRELLGFRRFFGPEQRDILMLWRNSPAVIFAEHHGREPGGIERVRTEFYCQHTTASHCRSTIGRRHAITISGIFHSIPTDGSGAIAKVGQSIRNLISCGRCINGVMHSLLTPSRFDLAPEEP
jgi:glycosyl transferase family 2